MARAFAAAVAGLFICGLAGCSQDASTEKGLQGKARRVEQAVPISAAGMPAEEVVHRLGELGGKGLPGHAKSVLSPREQLRLELYKRLLELGDEAMPSLVRGLHDPNFVVRREVVLFLGLGPACCEELRELHKPPMNVHLLLPDLVGALQDTDGVVRAWAAQTIGFHGRDAQKAVPNLITLLKDGDIGARNSACIALRMIGPGAKAALPALREALSDPSADARGFAAQAIAAIEQQ